MTHTPTRVDIRTQGWTSGTDMPLPRHCQTALCHHKEHQLKNDLTTAFQQEAAEPVPANRGWAMPSGLLTDPTRTHAEFYRRKWLKRGYQPETGWLNVLCSDLECDKKHSTSLPLDPPLDLPTVSIRRGGIRHWPMLPDFQVRVWRKRRWHRWQAQARVYSGQPWQTVNKSWSWKHACAQTASIARLNQDVYTRIKDHVTQHGWK